METYIAIMVGLIACGIWFIVWDLSEIKDEVEEVNRKLERYEEDKN
jgi:hypothetical protein